MACSEIKAQSHLTSRTWSGRAGAENSEGGNPSKAEGIFLSVGHSAEESREMRAERTCRFAEGGPVGRDAVGG